MTVLRIVPNLETNDTEAAKSFYQDFLGLDIVMDMGWINTYTSGKTMNTQISIATEGGAGTAVPDLSIEVDNVDELYHRAKSDSLEIVYDLVSEPWGVRRFYVMDPLGKCINILQHIAD